MTYLLILLLSASSHNNNEEYMEQLYIRYHIDIFEDVTVEELYQGD